MSTTSVIGSAVLLRFDGRLLFEVQSRNKWRYDESKVSTIGVGCIGGGIEGNETPIEALHREAIEEIGCELELDTPGNSLYVISGGKAIRAGEHLPSSGVSFFWGGYLTEHRSDTCVAVFHGTTLAQPSPIDLPAVLSIESEQFSSLLDGGLTLDELLELGGQIRSRETIPEEAILDPVGTAFLGRLRHVNEPLFQGCMSNRLPSGSPDDSSRDAGDLAYVELVDSVLDLMEEFSVIVTSDDITDLKPAADPYLKASDDLTIAPDRCIGFEDSASGVTALNGAEMLSVAVHPDHADRPELQQAEVRVSSLARHGVGSYA